MRRRRKSRRRRRQIIWGTVIVLMLCGIGGAWAWWLHTPEPPRLDFDGADPEVVQVINSARRQVQVDPRDPDTWGQLGVVLCAHAFFDEAAVCFQQAERLDSGNPRWTYLQAVSLEPTHPAEALVCLRRAVAKLDVGLLAPRYRLVDLLLDQGHLEEAERELAVVRKQQEDHVRGKFLQARLALARRQWKEARTEALMCVDDARARKHATLLAAEASRQLGEMTQAEELVQRARKLPEDVAWPDPMVSEVERQQVGVRVQMARAEALERDEKTDEAEQVLERALRANPKATAAWLLLGQIQRRQLRLTAAERSLQQAVGLEDGAEAWYELARVRYDLGRKQDAGAAFAKVVELKRDHAQGHYYLGLCYQESGDVEAARKSWEDALRCQPDLTAAREALEKTAVGEKKP